MPKYRFPSRSQPAEHAYAVVHDELMLDGNARMNLATFCQTWVEPEVHRVDGRMPGQEHRSTRTNIRRRPKSKPGCVHMLADLWNSPAAANTIGCSTTGSSEAAMLAGLALKWQLHNGGEPPASPTEQAQPDLRAGSGLLAQIRPILRRRAARSADATGPLSAHVADEVLRRVDENTIGVVPTLGVTFTCQYEPVQDICRASTNWRPAAGADVPVHVDAASGGFVAPFLDPSWPGIFGCRGSSRSTPRATSLAWPRLGCGWVIWREAADLPEELIFHVDYLGGDMPTFALNFPRPGGQVMCQYYNFLRLGREGYRHIQHACGQTAAYLAEQIAELGPFDVLHDGRSGLPAVCWTLEAEHRTWRLHALRSGRPTALSRLAGLRLSPAGLAGRGRPAGLDPARRKPRPSRHAGRRHRPGPAYFAEHPAHPAVTAADGSGFHH